MTILSDLQRLPKKPVTAAFIASFSVLFYEIVFFQTLHTLMNYIAATMVVAVALLGVAAGGIAAFVLSNKATRLMPVGLSLIGPTAMLAFFVASQFQDHYALVAAALCPPFFAAAFTISLAFSQTEKNGYIYAADLLGAGVGAVLAAILIPLIAEEGAIFTVGAVMALSPMLVLPTDCRRRTKLICRSVSAALFLLFGVVATVHFATNAFNVMSIAAPSTMSGSEQKLFNTKDIVSLKRTHGSLVERIDFLQYLNRGPLVAAYNGVPNDKISGNKEHHFYLDRRAPVSMLINRAPAADVLVIGASAEGINKTAKLIAQDDGTVTGLEYNTAITDQVLNRTPSYHARGHYWYEGMDLRNQDARTFLARSDQQFDMITMLNTHKVRTIGIEGPPEYLHTKEAVAAYLDHLTDNGALLIEERNLSSDCNAGIHNYLVTISDTLRERGQKPEQHILMYEYYATRQTNAQLSRAGYKIGDSWYGSKRYTIILVFKSPVHNAVALQSDWEDWQQRVNYFNHARRQCKGKNHCLTSVIDNCQKEVGIYYNDNEKWDCIRQKAMAENCKCGGGASFSDIMPRHLPWKNMETSYSKAISSADPSDVLSDEGYTLTVATTDKPFIQDVDLKQPLVDKIVLIVGIACLILVMLPLVFIGVRLLNGTEGGGRQQQGHWVRNLVLLATISGVVGLAYLFIEIVLVQWFSLFTGSPAASLTIILPSMLIFSGLGGVLSQHLSNKGLVIATAVVLVLSMLFNQTLTPLLNAMVRWPYAIRIAVSILSMAPLFIAMGIPFSFVLKTAYKQFSPSYPAMFFAINGALGALATPLAVKVSMNWGYSATMRLGAILYAVVLLFSFLMDKRTADE